MKLPLEERKQKSQHYLTKYPDSVPVFIESHSDGVQIPQIKILLKKSYNVSQFLKSIKKSAKQDMVLYLYSDKKVLKPTDTFETVYQKNKSQDGFLYLKVSEIQALG